MTRISDDFGRCRSSSPLSFQQLISSSNFSQNGRDNHLKFGYFVFPGDGEEVLKKDEGECRQLVG